MNEELERKRALSRERNRRYLAKRDPDVLERRKAAQKAYQDRLKNDPLYAEKAALRKAKAVARTKAWQRANPEKVKAHAKAVRQRNSAGEVAKVQRRNAAKKCAIPSWSDKEKIKRVYEIAARITKVTGVPHHVDHVIPLRGRLVSGLHVHDNLRVIAFDCNCSKSNHYEV